MDAAFLLRQGARLSEKVLDKGVLGKDSQFLRRVLRRGSAMGFTVKRVLRRVLRRGF